MSFRPRFPTGNNSFLPPPHSNNNMNHLSNPNFAYNSSSDGYQTNTQHNFPNCNMNPPNINPNPLFNPMSHPPAMHDINKSNNYYSNAFVSVRQPINAAPFPRPNSVNPSATGLLNSGPRLPNVSAPYNQYNSNQQTFVRNPVMPFNINSGNVFSNNAQTNTSNQNVPYPMQNTPYRNLPPINNYQGFQSFSSNNLGSSVPQTPLPPLPQAPMTVNENITSMMATTINNNVCVSENANNPVSQPESYMKPVTVTPMLVNSPLTTSSNLQNNYLVPLPLQMLKNDGPESSFYNMSNPLTCGIEIKLSEFLAKFSITKKKIENQVSIPEFRYAVKAVRYMMKLLKEKKNELTNFLDTEENRWKSEMQFIFNLKKELSAMCSFISDPVCLNNVIKKLKLIKKRRERKNKTKQNKFSEKIKAKENRKELNQEIDKWLDDITEKNLKLKREVEMKKEADFILLEVRRKIHEANKTIEKIKVFEKLRNVRQANAVKKGLHILSEHNEKFEKKMCILKETMLKQLDDYEAEEKALKVMLETEQEGQLEEEAQWKIKKAKTLQLKKQNHIKECLFGVSDEPLNTDPMYLFHKFHTSANNSIENLVQIRHQWDVHLSEDGETVPRQWIVPVAANNASWEQFLITRS